MKSSPQRRWLRPIWRSIVGLGGGALLLAAAGTTAPGTALAAPPAHADYVNSTPAAGSVVATAPVRVVARFSQALRPQGSSLTVLAPDGSRADAGDSAVDPTDASRTTMTVSLRSGLGSGTYLVNWTSVSADDGESDADHFTFSIGASSTNAELPRAGGGPSRGGATLAGAFGAALLAAGAVARRRV